MNKIGISIFNAICIGILSIAFAIGMTACNDKEIMFAISDNQSLPLVPLNRAARSASLDPLFAKKDQPIFKEAFFRFPSQVTLPTAVCITLQASDGVLPDSFFVGSLTTADFDDDGALRDSITSRPYAEVIAPSECVSVTFSMNSESVGFFVSARWPASAHKRSVIDVVSVVSANPYFGWQKTASGGYTCGFPSGGGSFSSIDCAYRLKNGIPNSIASWELSISVSADNRDLIQNVSTKKMEPAVLNVLSANGTCRTAEILLRNMTYTGFFPGIVFESQPTAILCTKNMASIVSVTIAEVTSPYAGASQYSGDLEPILIDPGLIPPINKKHWRRSEYELYAWDRFPSVLIFDTASYDIQAAFFKRLAFFVEKAGYRGKLLTDSEMVGKHGYNAHDYNAKSLADFFATAHRHHFSLNRYEMMLRDILITRGIITVTSDGFSAGQGAVVSISAESPQHLRTVFLVHEGLHGIYFTDDKFRKKVHEVYIAMPKYAITFIETYFMAMESLQYDIADRYLMENEFMAYVMQQPCNDIPKYFVGKYNRRLSMRHLIPEITTCIADTNASVFRTAADEFDQYAYTQWGLGCGRIHLLQSVPVSEY